MKTDGTLVILTPGFAASEEDDTCLPMQQSLVRTLGDLYPHVKIVILSFQYPYQHKTYNWHKATVHSFGGKNKGGLQRLLLRRTIIKTLRQIHHEEKIIGLLSFWYGECAAVGSLFGTKNGIRHCCWLLGQDARKGNKHPKRLPLPPNDLIALSDFIQNEFQKNYGVKPQHVVPPGINPQHVPKCASAKDIDILAAGSLIPLKQYDLFVKIVAEIRKEKPAIKAVLIGDGPEKKTLQNLIVRLSLQENLQLYGELPHKNVLGLMQRATVFLHPSSYEGFGVVCAEALYMGVQVVSFVQPMNAQIPNWHIVKTAKEMEEKTIKILQEYQPDYESNFPFCMQDTARKIMRLFI